MFKKCIGACVCVYDLWLSLLIDPDSPQILLHNKLNVTQTMKVASIKYKETTVRTKRVIQIGIKRWTLFGP